MIEDPPEVLPTASQLHHGDNHKKFTIDDILPSHWRERFISFAAWLTVDHELYDLKSVCKRFLARLIGCLKNWYESLGAYQQRKKKKKSFKGKQKNWKFVKRKNVRGKKNDGYFIGKKKWHYAKNCLNASKKEQFMSLLQKLVPDIGESDVESVISADDEASLVTIMTISSLQPRTIYDEDCMTMAKVPTPLSKI